MPTTLLGYQKTPHFCIHRKDLHHHAQHQLEQVIADESNALVRWRIDADLKTDNGLIRVRLPIATMLTFKENKIVSEYWVVDSIAFEKRFGAPLPF